MLTLYVFFFSSRRRHTRFDCDWSSDVCSSDLLAMGRIERFGNLNSQPQHLFQFQRTARDQVLEGDAVQIFHDDVGLAVLLADVMDGADIWMIQRRCSLGLAAKAGQRLWIASNF